MFSPLALLLIPLGYVFLWPWLDRLYRSQPDRASPLQIILTTVSLSVGLLALAMFWLGLLPGRWLTGRSALLVVAATLVSGLVVNFRSLDLRRWWQYFQAQIRRLVVWDSGSPLLWAMVGSLFIILIHSLYYPFIGDDALSRYGVQAQQIYSARRLPESVWGYPPLIPISFALTWFAAGGANEHLAKLVSVAMSAGLLGTTVLLSRHVLGRGPALLAGALVALTPFFVENATLPYTDIPSAFPLALATVCVLQWWQSGGLRNSVLAGALLGVALLTKQSAMTWPASFALIPPLWAVATRRQEVQPRSRRVIVGWFGMLLPPILIAGPWYVRNALIGGVGNMLPIAGLYHLLEPGVGLIGLVPSFAWPAEFGPLLSWLYALGWLIGLGLAALDVWRIVKGESTIPPFDLLLALVVLPYWLAWWTRFSFDARFLLLILPIMALWASRPLSWLLSWLALRVRLPHRLAQAVGAFMLSGLLVWGALGRLGGVYRALAQPFASEEQRIRQVKGDVYNLALYIRQNVDPSSSRLIVMDGALVYYLPGYDVSVMYPLTLADMEGYDYLVHSSSIFAVYGDRLGWNASEFYQHVWDPLIFEPVYETGGIHIMRILRTDVPSQSEYEAHRLAHPQEP